MLITEIAVDSITIKRSIGSTFGFMLLWSVGGMAFGGFFVYLGITDKNEIIWFPVVIGGLFVLIAVYLLFYLPSYYKKVSATGGDIILRANRDHLLLAPITNGPKIQYDWDMIQLIYLADIGRANSFAKSGLGDGLKLYGYYTNHNVILIIFRPGTHSKLNRGWLSNRKNCLHKTPRGKLYTYSEFSSDKKIETFTSLKKIAPLEVEVSIINRIDFDYHEIKEIYE